MTRPRDKPASSIGPSTPPAPSVGGPSSGDLFALHVQPHIGLLFGTAYSLTRNGTDAEDLVQETLLRAYRAIDRFDGRYPKAWLLTIMRNTNINRGQKKKAYLFDDPNDPAADRIEDVTPEDIVVEPVFEAAVQEALDALPLPFRAVVDLVDVNGLSYAEAADLLEIPVGTVMSRLHRGRSRIRQCLSPAAVANRTGER